MQPILFGRPPGRPAPRSGGPETRRAQRDRAEEAPFGRQTQSVRTKGLLVLVRTECYDLSMAKNEARTERIELRLTPSEAAQLAKLSTGLGVTKSQAVRQAVAAYLGEAVAGAPEMTGPGGPGEKAVIFQLDRIRTNLKQLEPIGLGGVKTRSGRLELIEYFEWNVPQTVFKTCLTDVEREKAASDLRDRIGRPLAELVLRHNRGETVEPWQVSKIGLDELKSLFDEWRAAKAA